MNKTENTKIFGRIIVIAMITSMFMVVSPMTASADPCEYQICLEDDWGDGWEGGIVDLSVNGVLIYDDLTILGGYGPECHIFSVNTNDEITTDYSEGSWSYENYYYIVDEEGYVVREEGAQDTIPGDIGPGELYAECPLDLWQTINTKLDELIDDVNAITMPNIIKQRLLDKLEYAKELKDNAHEECLADNFDAATKKLGVAKSQVGSFASMVKITRRISAADKASFLADAAEIIEKIDALIEDIETGA